MKAKHKRPRGCPLNTADAATIEAAQVLRGAAKRQRKDKPTISLRRQETEGDSNKRSIGHVCICNTHYFFTGMWYS